MSQRYNPEESHGEPMEHLRTAIIEMRTMLKNMDEKLDRVDEIVSGGARPERGLPARLLLLESNYKRHALWGRTSAGAALTAIIGTVWHWIKQHA